MIPAVSIAGAILWGVLRTIWRRKFWLLPFQSQGRFFGGCCEEFKLLIGEALGFNRRGDSLGGAAQYLMVETAFSHAEVSIAGAILWGVLHI